ncbi:serpin-Z10-like [Brassica napus]|uniref:serpin-Z10-like n=1 Tax=Brassica napus TaxID=3708 RepID=UPI00207A2668|nr:serpin-Z10-like [Brassica napus]
MVDSPIVGAKLYVSNILHKACIEVDEEGTEAAAVSVGVIRLQCLRKNPDFVADHPFLFTPAEVIDEVNTWAEVHTNVLINQILSKDSIEVIRQSTVIFANAVYIKGAWREKFNVRFTKDSDFHLLDGTSVKVPFMASYEDQYLRHYDGFQVVHLPYGNSPCIFIFPILEKDCPTLLEKVGSEPGFLDNHIPDYQIELADFRIPKFKFSFEFEASGESNLGQ